MSATDQATITVRLLEAADAGDTTFVDQLTQLVNSVYLTAESGLWRGGTTRTTGPELAELIHAGQIATATWQGDLAGCIRIHDVADDTSEFGMLVSAPGQRGKGVGRALVAFAERHSHGRGMRTMRLELLVPTDWQHSTKAFLKAWYEAIGYRSIRTTSIDDAYPHLAPLLATRCELTIFEKPLLSGSDLGPGAKRLSVDLTQ